MKSDTLYEPKDSFNFGDVYTPDHHDDLTGTLEIDGVTPSNVKPTVPSSRESVFIFQNAMLDPSLRNTTLTTISNISKPFSPASMNPFFASNQSPIKPNVLKPAKKVQRDEIQSNYIDVNEYASSPPLSPSLKQYVDLSSPPDDIAGNSVTPVSQPLKSIDAEDLAKWLTSLNYGKYTSSFVENDIIGSVLCEIESVADLIDCGVTMPAPIARAFLKELLTAKLNGVPKTMLS